MKKLLFISIIICTACSFARGQVTMEQFGELDRKVTALSLENRRLQSRIATLTQRNEANAKAIDSMRLQLDSTGTAIIKSDASLSSQIHQTKLTSEQKISQTSDLLSRKALIWIIVFLALTVVLAVLFILLSKRQSSDKTKMLEQLKEARTSIENNLVTEFSKQTKLMEAQLGVMETQVKANASNGNGEVDHSLALKLADEINLIERNISLMDSKTKGIKQLIASVGKLKDNLIANNYEIPELLGKPFHAGMKAQVTSSTPDENLAKGEEVITRVIKPQVNFNDKMIQTAQIEVSVGY